MSEGIGGEQGSSTRTSTGSAERDSSRRQLTIPSCHLCRKRKVKCDRGNPCSPCQRAGAECVYSAPSRLPRGRQGGRRKKDSELLQRIAKLENLVKDLESEDVSKATSPNLQSIDSSVSCSTPGDHGLVQCVSINPLLSPPKLTAKRSPWIILDFQMSRLPY